jgi:hypothetical protein
MYILTLMRKEEQEDQKKRWLDTIENDTKVIVVCIGDVEN